MLRLLHEQDLPDVVKVESACQIAPWSEEIFKKCMLAGSIGWVVELDAKIVGFILLLFQVDEVHILNFCVHTDYQHKGFGKQLLINALQEVKKQNAAFVYLEVRRSNQRAIFLYEKAGFHRVGERKDYYISSENREDALVFAMHLTPE